MLAQPIAIARALVAIGVAARGAEIDADAILVMSDG